MGEGAESVGRAAREDVLDLTPHAPAACRRARITGTDRSGFVPA
ncbi:protein of unknown function [Burkholderia multivorans]